MISSTYFTEYANSLPDVQQAPHFENVSFKIKGKIFATLNEKENRACVKLNFIDQSVFCAYKKEVMYPVPNKWGKHGWTNISLLLIPQEMLHDALQTAYAEVSKPKAQSK